MAKPDLKGCPFCGTPPRWKLGKVWHDQLHGEAHQDRIIECPRLCVAMAGDEICVVDRWNKRVLEGGEGMQPLEFRRALERLCDEAGRNMHWRDIAATLEEVAKAERDDALQRAAGR